MYRYQIEFSKYKLRDYEKKLALREFDCLFPAIEKKTVTDWGIEVHVNSELDLAKLTKLTFFSEFSFENSESKSDKIITNQAMLENYKNNGHSLFPQIHISKSREIRYLTHSLHEYKGRFYPQLVRTFMNFAGIKKGETVLDPFCGSGTTLVESVLYGVNAIGIDINPIAYMLTKTKVESLFFGEKEFKLIRKAFESLDDDLNLNTVLLDKHRVLLDIEYLLRWFPEDNLKKILHIQEKINLLTNENLKLFARVVLSNLLRDYSYQDSAQLRIRRRKNKPPSNLVNYFKENLKIQIENLEKFKHLNFIKYRPDINCYLGDVKTMIKSIKIANNSIDTIITSPPYATALPYIDTDRLSLFAFGYTDKSNFRKLEESLIGNREITKSQRINLDNELMLKIKKSLLPVEIITILKKIYLLNEQSDVGFRRKNTAALLYKYFVDMHNSLEQMSSVLKKGKFAFIVIGNNRTTAGGEVINIPTDDFIGLISERNGFKILEKINLTVQKPYQIHSKNSINTESVLVLKKR